MGGGCFGQPGCCAWPYIIDAERNRSCPSPLRRDGLDIKVPSTVNGVYQKLLDQHIFKQRKCVPATS